MLIRWIPLLALSACGSVNISIEAATTTAHTAQPLSNCQITLENQDILARLLRDANACPTAVRPFRALLESRGAELRPTLVDNRGFHNSAAGSFSLFERVTGEITLGQSKVLLTDSDLFFGHFTERDEDGRLALAERPDEGALMIELIAWDEQKAAYNFYELIGDGSAGQWFYRGDSFDIFADNQKLHLSATPQFGARLRCSGCHQGGGPIMKEITAPHNDWWTHTRPLPLGGDTAQSFADIFASIKDASELASAVRQGQTRITRPHAQLQQLLRPLFCPEEVNFVSASGKKDVPSEWIVDPRLATASLSSSDYSAALTALKMRFPETTRRDGDHAWLAPVRAAADTEAVGALLSAGFLTDEFVADVLAIDFTHPVVSDQRCALLHAVPAELSDDWQTRFIANLATLNTEAASALITNLQTENKGEHVAAAQALLGACAQQLQTAQGTTNLLAVLATRRSAVARSAISKNPRGQILEPGFRVIFPVPGVQLPADLSLNASCDVL